MGHSAGPGFAKLSSCRAAPIASLGCQFAWALLIRRRIRPCFQCQRPVRRVPMFAAGCTTATCSSVWPAPGAENPRCAQPAAAGGQLPRAPDPATTDQITEYAAWLKASSRSTSSRSIRHADPAPGKANRWAKGFGPGNWSVRQRRRKPGKPVYDAGPRHSLSYPWRSTGV